MQETAVTVVIPTRYAHPYLQQALESVARQSFTAFEALIVDDGSGRGSEIRALLGSLDSRFKYLTTPAPSGPGAARNLAIRAARTPYVAFLDDDDTWKPNLLTDQLAYLQRHPELDLVYADAVLDGSEAVAGRRFMELAPSRGPVTIDSLLACRCAVLTSSVVAKRDKLMAVGLFTEERNRQEDFDLWVRLAHSGGRLGYQRRVLGTYRVHAQSLSWDRERMLSRQLETFSALDEQLALSPQSRRRLHDLADYVRAAYSFDLAKDLLAQQRYGDAALELARAKSFRRDLRIEAALLGVSHWPRLTRGLYQFKQTWQTAFRRKRFATVGATANADNPNPLGSDAIDRAGKAYWDAIWSTPADSLQAVDPRTRSIWGYRDRQFHQIFADLFARRNGQSAALMEIGCARSVWLPYFAREFRFSVFGLDYSERGAREAREVLEGNGVDGSIACTDLFQPPAGWLEKFDVVVSFGVMEHFQDTANALHGAGAYLKPGGLMITEIPNLVGINGWLQRLVNKPVFDIHIPMSTDTLAAQHRAAGLDVLKCEYVVAPDFGVLNLAGLQQNLIWRIKDRLLFALRLFTGFAWWLDQKIGPVSPGRLSAGFVICIARKPMNAVAPLGGPPAVATGADFETATPLTC